MNSLYITFFAISRCEQGDAKACLQGAETKGLMSLLEWGLNLLAATAGIAAVGMLIYASILYITSNGDPGKVADAKKKIGNIIGAFIAFFFLYAFMQWLIPGGLF